jgi:hypothetical protein
MTRYAENELVLHKGFDANTCRHQVNDITVVLHCHHYATLYTQLAMDCSMLDATKLLAECSEDAWQEFLCGVFQRQECADLATRFALAEQTFAAVGLGKMRVRCAGPDSGEVELERSHVDEGWIMKWGHGNTAVNFIGAGFIAAMFSAVFDRPLRSYLVTEVQSLVCGAASSRFIVAAH